MNWIVDYVTLIDQVSESPKQFNMWAAISVISSVLKRNVKLKYKTFDLYPNHYIVFVAPPGIGKGAAIHPAHAFAKDLNLVNYMSDRVTAPRIIERLHQGFIGSINVQSGQVSVGPKDSTATLMSTELPTLLSSSEWMLQFLCDTWDRGEFDYDTKNKGSYTVTGMGVSLIGACVPDFIRKINKDAMAPVSSGFSARTIFVNAKQKSKSLPWGEGYKNNTNFAPQIKILEDRLRDISKLRGEFILEPNYARPAWDSWYDSHDKTSSEDDSEVLRNFKARQPIHVLKLAMILSVAEADNLVITQAILKKAIALIDHVAAGVDEIFRSVGEADLSAGIAKLEIYIERKKKVTWRELLKDNMRFINHDDIIKILKILETIGFVSVKMVGSDYVWEHTGQPLNSAKILPNIT